MTEFRDELRAALYDLLLAGIDFPLRLENQKFNPPSEPFAACYLIFTGSAPMALGTRFQRHTGIFGVECLVPEDTGMKLCWNMASAVERAIPEQQISLAGAYATTRAAKAGRNLHQDGFYSVLVEIPFHVDVCV